MPVKQKEFDAWTKADLFLHGDQDGAMISTEDGDLLMDPRLRGNLYLKGLLLGESTSDLSASHTNRPLKFGYNFASGTTNRERQSVADTREESRHILAIWSKVLAVKPEMVSELSDMLNTAEPGYADVFEGKIFIDHETACRLKKYLVGEPFAGKWYYCGEDKKKVRNAPQLVCTRHALGHYLHHFSFRTPGLITSSMDLGTRVPSSQTYWAILRRHSLAHTAEEEELRRFMAAPDITVGDSPFARSVRRLLRACLRACPQTNEMTIRFVQAGQLHLQVFFFEDAQVLRVHERWPTAHGAVDELGLPGDLVDADIAFHIVKRLFADALEQLPLHMFLEPDSSRIAEWRRKSEISLAEQRLLGYRRIGDLNIEVIPGCPDLRLNWAMAPDSPNDMVVEIQYHKASRCCYLQDSLLITHHERYLKEDEEYFFVLVARADPGSFAVVSSIARTSRRQPSPNRARLVERQSTRAMAHTSAPARATAREGSFCKHTHAGPIK
jgi:hypothetical protein